MGTTEKNCKMNKNLEKNAYFDQNPVFLCGL